MSPSETGSIGAAVVCMVAACAYKSRLAILSTVMGAKPARLLRKTTIIPGGSGHLPVHTLTFASEPLGVRMDMGDVIKVIIPGYKPKSYSMSAEREGEFDITFKVYPSGRCSGYLDSLEVGDTANVFAKGDKKRRPGTHVGLIAFGVGITEALPVAAAELAKPDATEVVLVWASRTPADTFWHDRIKDLQERHPDTFTVVHAYSQENVAGALHGRLNPDMLKGVFARWGAVDAARFVTVGTKPMMAAADAMLAAIGFPMPEHALLTH